MKSSEVNIFIDVYFKIKKTSNLSLLCFKSRLRIILFGSAKPTGGQLSQKYSNLY